MSDTYAARSMHAFFCCSLMFCPLALPYRHASSLFDVYTYVQSFCDVSCKKKTVPLIASVVRLYICW